MTEKNGTETMILDGVEVSFTPGETIYEVASRNSAEIPTLCYDKRLDPFGGCRMCVVELEGARNPVASCTTKASSPIPSPTSASFIRASSSGGTGTRCRRAGATW